MNGDQATIEMPNSVKQVHLHKSELREISAADMQEAANQGFHVPSNTIAESAYGGGGQTAYGGGQTAYDAGKTPMAVNTPQYFPTTPGYNDGGYGGTGNDDYYGGGGGTHR